MHRGLRVSRTAHRDGRETCQNCELLHGALPVKRVMEGAGAASIAADIHEWFGERKRFTAQVRVRPN
jgi:hypothetical protein